MSNYLIASIPKNCSYRSKMLEFTKFFVDEVSTFLYGDLEFFVFSKYSGEAYGNYLKGIAINHEKERILFHDGFNLLNEYTEELKAAEGCFITIVKNHEDLNIFSDKFGVMPKLYTKFSQGGGAVSDSIFLLLKLRHFLNETCDINENNFISRSWFNAITYQQINTETICNQVRYLPTNGLIKFRKHSYDMEVVDADLNYLIDNQSMSYKEGIKAAAHQICGVLSGISKVPGAIQNLSASGGLDSRVLMCAFSYIKKRGYEGSFRVGCRDNGSGDFELASNVVEKIKLPFNYHDGVPRDRKRVDKLTEWLSFCCGIYDPLYTAGSYVESDSVLHLGGHGGGLFKGAYGWREIDSIGKSILDDNLYEKFNASLKQGVKSLGLDEYSSIASEFHYLGYRNALHGGRILQSTVLGVRPLVNEKLTLLAHSYFKGKDPYQISHDLAILLDSDIAVMPYDHPSKGIIEETLQERKDFFGPLAEIAPYSVLGHPAALRSGALVGAVRLVNNFLEEHNIPKDYDKLKGFLKEFLMDSGIIDISTSERLIETMLDEKSEYKSNASAGKVLSLYVTYIFSQY